MTSIIAVDELGSLREKGTELKLIDTLPGEYFDACHIPGACNSI